MSCGVVDASGGTSVYGHEVTERDVCLRYGEVGSFLIRDGESIVVERNDGVSADVIRNFVLGPALGVALHQRGLLVLHASAVALGGRAVVFLGGSEWGKSTVAAACYVAGHPLIADDTVAVAFGGGTAATTLGTAATTLGTAAAAVPAIPRIKLWPESMRVLGLDPERFDRVHEQLDKRQLPAAEGFPRSAVPIAAIYVLTEGDVGLAPVEGSEAVIELVRHSYAVDLLQASMTQGRHFRQCADLLRRVPVRRLSTGAALEDVLRVPALVAADL